MEIFASKPVVPSTDEGLGQAPISDILRCADCQSRILWCPMRPSRETLCSCFRVSQLQSLQDPQPRWKPNETWEKQAHHRASICGRMIVGDNLRAIEDEMGNNPLKNEPYNGLPTGLGDSSSEVLRISAGTVYQLFRISLVHGDFCKWWSAL